MKFTYQCWDELSESGFNYIELDLDITEDEITADRLNVEYDKYIVGDTFAEMYTDDTQSSWPTAGWCRDGKAMAIIARNAERGYLCFMTVTW